MELIRVVIFVISEVIYFELRGIRGTISGFPKGKAQAMFFLLRGELFVIGTVQDVTSYKLSNTMSRGKRYRLRHLKLAWRLHWHSGEG